MTGQESALFGGHLLIILMTINFKVERRTTKRDLGAPIPMAPEWVIPAQPDPEPKDDNRTPPRP